MNQPELTRDVTTITLEYPSDWEVRQILAEEEVTTLGGTILTDVSYRKFQYILIWDALWTDKYDELEGMINDAIDNDQDLSFVYDKWPFTEIGVTVKGRLSPRSRVLGGGQNYYSKVTLTLTQVEKEA